MSNNLLPVLIVGAGPTGLTLANLLTQYKVPFRIIDQKIEPIETSNALAIQSRSLEMWQHMGIIEKVAPLAKKIQGLALHRLGKEIAKISFENLHLDTAFPYIMAIPQAESEKILTENLLQPVERGLKLDDLSQEKDGVSAHLVDTQGQKEFIRCQYLIAADGCHSSIRKKLNLAFTGDTIPEKFIMMDAEIKSPLHPDFFHVFSSFQGPVVFAPMKDFTRIIAIVTHDQNIKDFTQPTIDDFNFIIKERSHQAVTIKKPLWISHFMTQHRIINQYVHDRILFAGDSAHIHSPIGGQGMNTGMQDCFNFAWKLAMVVKKKSHPRLLKSYDQERYPIAKKVLTNTTRGTHFVTLKNPLLISFRDFILKFAMKSKYIQHKIINNISELGIRYSRSAFIINNLSYANKIKAGMRAPNTTMMGYNLKHHVLLFGNDHTLREWINNKHNDLFEVTIVSDKNIYKAYDAKDGDMFIIRPDLYIGYSGNSSKNSILHYLANALCTYP